MTMCRAIYQLSVVAVMLGTIGCAQVGQRDAAGNPALLRAAPDQLAAGASQAPSRLSAEDIVSLSRQGESTEQIMARYRASGTRLRINPVLAASLRERGVDARTVAAINDAEQEAERTDRVSAQVDRETAASIRAEQARPTVVTPSYGYAPWGYNGYYSPRVSPYMGYGWGPWRRGWHGGIGIGF